MKHAILLSVFVFAVGCVEEAPSSDGNNRNNDNNSNNANNDNNVNNGSAFVVLTEGSYGPADGYNQIPLQRSDDIAEVTASFRQDGDEVGLGLCEGDFCDVPTLPQDGEYRVVAIAKTTSGDDVVADPITITYDGTRPTCAVPNDYWTLFGADLALSEDLIGDEVNVTGATGSAIIQDERIILTPLLDIVPPATVTIGADLTDASGNALSCVIEVPEFATIGHDIIGDVQDVAILNDGKLRVLTTEQANETIIRVYTLSNAGWDDRMFAVPRVLSASLHADGNIGIVKEVFYNSPAPGRDWVELSVVSSTGDTGGLFQLATFAVDQRGDLRLWGDDYLWVETLRNGGSPNPNYFFFNPPSPAASVLDSAQELQANLYNVIGSKLAVMTMGSDALLFDGVDQSTACASSVSNIPLAVAASPAHDLCAVLARDANQMRFVHYGQEVTSNSVENGDAVAIDPRRQVWVGGINNTQDVRKWTGTVWETNSVKGDRFFLHPVTGAVSVANTVSMAGSIILHRSNEN